MERLEERAMLAAGSLDTTFNPAGAVPGTLIADFGFTEDGQSIAVQSDGKILIAGTVGDGFGKNFGVARFLADGTLDSTFGTSGLATVDFHGRADICYDLAVGSFDKIILVGQASSASDDTVIGVARLTANGALDTTFNVTGKETEHIAGFVVDVRAVALQSDGTEEMIVVTGLTRPLTGGVATTDFLTARFTDSGSLDTAFGAGAGYVMTDFNGGRDEAYDVAIQSDGKIVIGGITTDLDGVIQFALARYDSNGTLDASFGTSGLVRTNVTGPISGSGDLDVIESLIVYDDKIVVAGHTDTAIAADAVVARYDASGSLDESFNADGSQKGILSINLSEFEYADGIALQANGDYVVAGRTKDGTNEQLLVMRILAATGELDMTFGTGGTAHTDFSAGAAQERFRDVVIQANGKIVAGGQFDATDFVLARYEYAAVTDSISGPANVNEGATYTLTTTSGDPTTSQWTITWGDGSEDEVVPDNPSTVTHVYADGDNEYTISATIMTDSGTITIGNTVTVAVQNVAPTVAISGAGSVDEGSLYSLTLGALTDPGMDTITQYIVHWGDGATDMYGSNGVVTHTYADGPNAYNITVDLVDEDGTFVNVANPLSISVKNVDPTANDATFSVAENSPNGTVVGTFTASDPGTDTLTYSIIGGTGAAAFAIDSMTGEITVLDGSLLDFETTPSLLLDVQIDDGDGGFDTALITIDLINLASVSGVVYVDVNQNGQFDANEPGIGGVEIELLDQFGNAVLDEFGDPITAVTDSSGFYLFEDLAPGIYQLLEIQPTGVTDGDEQLGSLGGTIVANDLMQLTLTDVDAFDYVFAEIGQQLTAGDAAGIGFWQNKHGQQLITQGGTQLAEWLTANFSNIFGNTLVGASGADVATFYREQLFKQKGKKSAGPAKVDAQFMAVALATYFTSSTLAGQTAATFGFNVTDTGIGTKIVNVGTKGAAFNVANGSDLTIMQLLMATDSLTDQPDATAGFAAIYDTDGDGSISTAEANLRTLANSIFGGINEAGGI